MNVEIIRQHPEFLSVLHSDSEDEEEGNDDEEEEEWQGITGTPTFSRQPTPSGHGSDEDPQLEDDNDDQEPEEETAETKKVDLCPSSSLHYTYLCPRPNGRPLCMLP